MPFEPQRIIDVKWAFGTKQQTNMATVLVDGDLDKTLPLIGTQVAQVSRQFRSDINWTGKGHEFATPGNHHEFLRDLTLDRTLDLSSLIAGWACAFGMGKVVTDQPSPALNPNCYRHKFTFFDPAVAATKQVPVTTVYEEISSGAASFQQKLRAMAVDEFAITGRAREVLQLAMKLTGSGERAADAVTVGAVTTVSLLDMGGMTFNMGALGATTDISNRLLEFSVNIKQNLDLANGYYPGTGLYRGRLWIGMRRATFTARVWVDAGSADMYDLWLDQTKQEVQFKIEGDLVTAGQPEKHTVDILFPSERLTAAPIGEADGKLIYEISVTEDTVYKDSAAAVQEPVQITVINDVPTYLALPA